MQDAATLPEPYVQVALMSMDVLALVADAVICTDDEGRILVFNRAAERTFGYSRSEVIGQNVEMLLPRRFWVKHSEQVRDFAAGGGDTDRLMGRTREVWGLRKNGEEFPAEATVSRQTINGRTILTVVHRDVSERKELEERRESIARELDHRIVNLLSVVGSLVRLSARDAKSIGDFEESLLERLSALARTQRTLQMGSQQGTSLRKVISAELEQYRSSKTANVIIAGPSVSLGSRTAQTLALVFHELATNASKHGALRCFAGHVSVTSAFVEKDHERFLGIEWRETGGPAADPPRRPGFGTGFIRALIEKTFRTDVVMNYLPEGLVCRIMLPVASLAADG